MAITKLDNLNILFFVTKIRVGWPTEKKGYSKPPPGGSNIPFCYTDFPALDDYYLPHPCGQRVADVLDRRRVAGTISAVGTVVMNVIF